jgi:hypothetical protein
MQAKEKGSVRQRDLSCRELVINQPTDNSHRKMTFLDNIASKLALSQVELREECWRSRGEVPVPAFRENHLYSQQNVGIY